MQSAPLSKGLIISYFLVINNPSYGTEKVLDSNSIPKRNMPKGMLYFQRDQISIINSKWVLAYYEDGHFDGELLARFKVDESGNISWRVIDDDR